MLQLIGCGVSNEWWTTAAHMCCLGMPLQHTYTRSLVFLSDQYADLPNPCSVLPGYISMLALPVLLMNIQVDEGLRQLSSFLATVDPGRNWGGLALVDISSAAATPGIEPPKDSNGMPNEVLWVCKACLSGKRGAGQGGGNSNPNQHQHMRLLQSRVDTLQRYIKAQGLPLPPLPQAGGGEGRPGELLSMRSLRRSIGGMAPSSNAGSKGGLLGCFPAAGGGARVHPAP